MTECQPDPLPLPPTLEVRVSAAPPAPAVQALLALRPGPRNARWGVCGKKNNTC